MAWDYGIDWSLLPANASAFDVGSSKPDESFTRAVWIAWSACAMLSFFFAGTNPSEILEFRLSTVQLEMKFVRDFAKLDCDLEFCRKIDCDLAYCPKKITVVRRAKDKVRAPSC